MKCSSCGCRLRAKAKFCTRCGLAIPAITAKTGINPRAIVRRSLTVIAIIAALGVIASIVAVILQLTPPTLPNGSEFSLTTLRTPPTSGSRQTASTNSVARQTTTSHSAQSTGKASAVTSAATTVPDIAYSLSHLSKAIQVLNNYMNYGTGCDFDDEIVYLEAWKFLSESQAPWVCDLLHSACCSSITEAKRQLSLYLADTMYADFSSDAFVEYRGILYIALGGVGYVEYDSVLSVAQITRTAYNKIYLITKQYGSDGQYCCDTRIDFEYRNGSYKIVRVVDLQ